MGSARTQRGPEEPALLVVTREGTPELSGVNADGAVGVVRHVKKLFRTPTIVPPMGMVPVAMVSARERAPPDWMENV